MNLPTATTLLCSLGFLTLGWGVQHPDHPAPPASTPVALATYGEGGGVQPGSPVEVGTKVCDAQQLQDTSCTNPGNCRNACAFWCDSARQCRACCQAFRRPSRSDCMDRCDEVWNP